MPVYNCFLCNRPFQFGPNAFEGRHIGSWGIQICEKCIRANWDGIMLQEHPQLITHLDAKGIPFKLNPMGFLDIPSS